MRFLHTGDLHLDSAFCGVGATDAEALRDRQRELLKRIFALAGTEGCELILMAGDVFDSVFVTPETSALFVRLCKEYEGPVVIAPGNHDPYVDGGFYKNSSLPQNVLVFTAPELQYFDIDELGVTVAGYAFTSSALARSPLCDTPRPREQSERRLILCAHGEVEAAVSRYAPVTLGDISRHGFDYAAFGHIHNPAYFGERVRYCGFPEGRGFDELGDGGAFVVDIDDMGEVTARRHILSEVVYRACEVSVEGACEPAEIEALVKAEAERHGAQTRLRVKLVGVTAMEDAIDTRALCEAAGRAVASLEIEDATLSLPDGASLERDMTLRGELFRTLRPMLTCDRTEDRERAMWALRIGLAAIDGKKFTDGGRE